MPENIVRAAPLRCKRSSPGIEFACWVCKSGKAKLEDLKIKEKAQTHAFLVCRIIPDCLSIRFFRVADTAGYCAHNS